MKCTFSYIKITLIQVELRPLFQIFIKFNSKQILSNLLLYAHKINKINPPLNFLSSPQIDPWTLGLSSNMSQILISNYTIKTSGLLSH